MFGSGTISTGMMMINLATDAPTLGRTNVWCFFPKEIDGLMAGVYWCLGFSQIWKDLWHSWSPAGRTSAGERPNPGQERQGADSASVKRFHRTYFQGQIYRKSKMFTNNMRGIMQLSCCCFPPRNQDARLKIWSKHVETSYGGENYTTQILYHVIPTYQHTLSA